MKINGILNHGDKKDKNGRFVNEDGLKILEFPNNHISIGIIMDGATGLGKKYEIKSGITPAEWYVKTMLNSLREIFSQSPFICLEEAIKKSITILQLEIEKFKDKNNIELTKYEEPSAGITVIRVNEKITEIYILGDLTTIVGYTSGEIQKLRNPNEEKLKKYDNDVIKEMVIRAKETNRNVIDTRNDQKIQEMLQNNRSKKNSNQDDSYYVCGTVPSIVNQGVHYNFLNKNLKRIICISDGVEYDVLGDNEYSFYNRLDKETPEKIVKEIRKVEKQDNLCNKFPRFKQSDDISFLVVDYKK